PIEREAKCCHRGLGPLQQEESVGSRQPPLGVGLVRQVAYRVEVREPNCLNNTQERAECGLLLCLVWHDVELRVPQRVEDTGISEFSQLPPRTLEHRECEHPSEDVV